MILEKGVYPNTINYKEKLHFLLVTPLSGFKLHDFSTQLTPALLLACVV